MSTTDVCELLASCTGVLLEEERSKDGESRRNGLPAKKQKAKRDRKRDAVISFAKLPTELIIQALTHLQPGDVLRVGLVNRRLRSLVDANANVIGNAIIHQRYPLLAQCLD